MQNGNEQIGNIDEIIGVNSSSSIKNTEKKVQDDDDDIQMEVIEEPQIRSNSSKLLPVKKVVVPPPVVYETTTIIDDDDVQVQNSDEIVKMDTSEKEQELEERPSVSLIPIPRDSSKTNKSTHEDAGKVSEKPDVELIDTTELSLKNSSISSAPIPIN